MPSPSPTSKRLVRLPTDSPSVLIIDREREHLHAEYEGRANCTFVFYMSLYMHILPP
jgi:hypothetical protein